MNINDNLEKLEVLSSLYNEIMQQEYPSRQSADLAALKMKLLKKEMLLLSYMVQKDISQIMS